ncbi:class F sortase [Nocardioides eburneiflavus]|uniref:Class F sortase n=1 Tax=Nocardioides eburneiflavus TaxID=2518372 RepID=A0A4Z1CIZ3_9ACTN|nr:class F sortase [Nocardioides eburneiflavus]
MSPGRAPGVAVAAAMLAVLGGCADAPTESPGSGAAPAPVPAESSSGTAGATPVAPARRAPSVAQAQPPRSLTLPSGLTVAISAVGTTRAGLLDVPADVAVAGWWEGGARLGDPFGSVLVAAHVDSRTQGLGPFAELLEVDRGDRLLLESAGLRQSFGVRSRRLVPQGSLVDDSWLFDAAGPARLTLVTCAPPYVAFRGGYQNLAVVTAVPLGRPEER